MAVVYLIRCRDPGQDCDFETSGSSRDEVMENCMEHSRREHAMRGFGRELYAKMLNCLRVIEDESPA